MERRALENELPLDKIPQRIAELTKYFAESKAELTARHLRMASATVGAPLEELTINFGAARMLIIPLREDAVLVVMLERDTATRPVRSVLDFELPKLKGLLETELGNGGLAMSQGGAHPGRVAGASGTS